MNNPPRRRVLVCADMTCLKQTFVARANAALSAAGLDYRMMFTRGDWQDAELDKPVSTSIRFALAPRLSDLLFLPLVLLAYLFSATARAYLRATYQPELGKRLSLSRAVINYRTYRHAKQWQPDSMLVHFMWNLDAALPLAEALGVPVLGVAHGSDVLLDDKWTGRVGNGQLRHIFCISNALRQRVDPVAARHGKTTSLLHNPVSPIYLEQAHPPVAGPIRVACIATLRELKNHAWLFRALKLLKDKGVPFSCDIVGEPFQGQAGFRDVLRNAVDALGIAPHCRFLGWLKPAEARDLIDACTVLVLPSRSEGMGMVIVEAIARRRTPVGTDIPGIGEAMFGGEAGYLCPLDDDAALAAAIESAHHDTLHRQDKLEQARQRVAREFSSEKYAEELVRHLALATGGG